MLVALRARGCSVIRSLSEVIVLCLCHRAAQLAIVLTFLLRLVVDVAGNPSHVSLAYAVQSSQHSLALTNGNGAACRQRAYMQAAELLLSFLCVPLAANAVAVPSAEPPHLGATAAAGLADAQQHALSVLASKHQSRVHMHEFIHCVSMGLTSRQDSHDYVTLLKLTNVFEVHQTLGWFVHMPIVHGCVSTLQVQRQQPRHHVDLWRVQPQSHVICYARSRL